MTEDINIKKSESAPVLTKDEALKAKEDALKAKYGKVYRVGATIEIDDDTEREVEYVFKKPSTGSYDRYVKTASQSMSKSLKAFLFDNVVEEDRVALETDLEEFPALALSMGEKLLSMLGLSKQTNLKML